MYESWRERLGNRRKVAIVGFCQSSRELAPYDDPEFEIWGLNRGYLFMPRADRWFEMHGQNIYSNQVRRPGRHVDWLNAFPGPVYMHRQFEEIKTCQVYPLQEMADFFGPNIHRIGTWGGATNPDGSSGPHTWLDRTADKDITGEPYLSSSIAYEIALAIYEGFSEIHLYGVDLNTEAEYAWQKPGVEFLLGWAAGHGIRVVLPDNCPLLKGTLYGRGFLSERPEHMSYDQLGKRMAALRHDHEIIQLELAKVQGARYELSEYVSAQMVPGIDHERVQDRIKEMDKIIGDRTLKLNVLQGQIQETAYWVSQTMAGQEPSEAMEQLRKLDEKELAVEGPVTDFEVLTDRQNGYHSERVLEPV